MNICRIGILSQLKSFYNFIGYNDDDNNDNKII